MILEGMRVPGWSEVYALGCIDHRVTLYSQQVRALNLAAALVATGNVHAGEPVVIIGAGAAGLTCAAGLMHLGVEVIVLERREKILPLFDGGSRRWLHPRVYDWPFDGWDQGNAGLPLLTWACGKVGRVRAQLVEGWEAARQGTTLHLNVEEVTSIGTSTDSPRTVTWIPGGEQRTRTLILAVGFGLEPERPRYWEGDNLDADPSDGGERKWLVSGSGDGGLTDLLRLCIRGFGHDRMVKEFLSDPRMDSIRGRILEIETDPKKVGKSDVLHEDYLGLDAPWVQAIMKERRREKNVVRLATETANYLGGGASPLNRFLASQLRKTGCFEPIPSRVVDREREGGKVRVRFANKKSELFDQVVIRHGPTPALKEGCLEEIDDALAARRDYRRANPISTDQTRERFWIEGVFGDEKRSGGPGPGAGSSSGEESSGGTPVVAGLTPEELATYREAVRACHGVTHFIGFPNPIAYGMTWEQLYVELDMVKAHGHSKQELFVGAELEAEGADGPEKERKKVGLDDAFGYAERCNKRAMVLLGDPGSGKTTQLEQMLLRVLDKEREPESLGLPEGTVPVFVPIRELSPLLPPKGPLPKLEQLVLGALPETLGQVSEVLAARLLGSEHVLYLLDGLDEIPDPARRARMAKVIASAQRRLGKHYLMVSSRYAGYADIKEVHLGNAFLELRLERLDDEQVEQLVHNWHQAVEAMDAKAERRPASLEAAERRADKLLWRLRAPRFSGEERLSQLALHRW